MSGMLAPTLRETRLGEAEILEVFNVSKVGKGGRLPVCSTGTSSAGAHVRLIRDNLSSSTKGKLSQAQALSRMMPVKFVAGQGNAGMAFENYQDMRKGDVIECYTVRRGEALIVRTHSALRRGARLRDRGCQRPDPPHSRHDVRPAGCVTAGGPRRHSFKTRSGGDHAEAFRIDGPVTAPATGRGTRPPRGWRRCCSAATSPMTRWPRISSRFRKCACPRDLKLSHCHMSLPMGGQDEKAVLAALDRAS